MPVDTANLRRSLTDFDFRGLFVDELGWNRGPRQPLSVSVNGQTYLFQPVAEKRGMMVLWWEAPAGQRLPDRATRAKIYREVSKLHFEHLLIFTDATRRVQEWTWVRREPGKPLAPRVAHWRWGQSNEALMQRLAGLAIGLEEEEDLTLVDVTGRVRRSFDVERVTKRFYDRFKTEHAAFLKFVKGIGAQGDQEWYASVMLNRLMFVYFIQKKGFLDGDRDYLRSRLARVQAQYGNGKFHSFYRSFLLCLFHEGLGGSTHSPQVKQLLGRVPYMNGGLFDFHQLERTYPDIQIADDAFVRIFDFFDAYEWHLDERPLRADNEINPDVLGYIFEKYINQKQMGAYYTKEDITEYIGKNTILPYLFDASKRRCEVAFRREGALWGLLRDIPDRYIYPAVRKGVIDEQGNVIPLPSEIGAGVDNVAERGGWNRPAAEAYALPTETWREHVARRTRCLEVREKLRSGEVHEINDLVTYNLDIRQFAEDVIFNSEGPELLRAFWISLAGRVPVQSNEKPEHGITVLDPTCGSGAFLFAALNILKPLYEMCLQRMQEWVDEADAADPASTKFKDFREILARVNDRRHHPNRDYYVLKSIILNNLFGVDIMEEAVEICKLRLFLKLVAQVGQFGDIEPLPDIDFNIRAGNTLVGFATLEEVRRAVEGVQQAELMLGDKSAVLRRIEEDAETVDRAYRQFQEMQTREGMAANTFHEAKAEVRRRLEKLDEELNRYLAKEYGVNPDRPKEFANWKDTHQPFHWFVAFYGIMSRGGFDVIIGNPPYVEYSKVRNVYRVLGYHTEGCGNLYAYVTERCAGLGHSYGRIGLIVPMSFTSIREYQALRDLVASQYPSRWVTNHAIRPVSLFTGISQRVSILFGARGAGHSFLGTRYLRTGPYLDKLFQQPWFEVVPEIFEHDGIAPKISTPVEQSILAKLEQHAKLGAVLAGRGSHDIFIKDYGETYWVFPFSFVPWLTPVRSYKTITVGDAQTRDLLVAAFNSTLFYWFYTAISDCWHFGKWHMLQFPLGYDAMAASDRMHLVSLGQALAADLQANRITRYDARIEGNLFEYKVSASKPIIDEIDRVLAHHYGFTDEELDFIINYDIKYRMGREALDAGESAEDAA
jgi:hypothetical protein